MLFHLKVQFLHFAVTNDLFGQEFVLFSLVLNQVQYPGVHTISLDLIEVHSADVALAAYLLPLLQKVGDVRIGLLSQPKLVQRG